MPTADIIKTLYEHYYQHDQTPSTVVSSYWKEMHQKAHVRMEGDVLHLKGYAFGDMQQASWPYLVCAWGTIAAHLCHISHRLRILFMMGRAIRLSQRMKLPFTYDSFRQVCTLELLSRHWAITGNASFNVLCIGDGYGFLSCLIKELYPMAKIYLVDLGKTLIFQAHFARYAHPQYSHTLVSEHVNNLLLSDFNYCPAEFMHCLDALQFDAAINIDSMQEMNESTVQRYFDFLRSHLKKQHLFYCCNREEKIMPAGEVSRIMDYPWNKEDRYIVDEICPWYSFYLSYHPTEKGLRLFNRRVFGVNYFDGVIIHRLCQMQTT